MGLISDLGDMIRAMREPREDSDMEAQVAKLNKEQQKVREESESNQGREGIVPRVKVPANGGKAKKGRSALAKRPEEMER